MSGALELLPNELSEPMDADRPSFTNQPGRNRSIEAACNMRVIAANAAASVPRSSGFRSRASLERPRNPQERRRTPLYPRDKAGKWLQTRRIAHRAGRWCGQLASGGL